MAVERSRKSVQLRHRTPSPLKMSWHTRITQAPGNSENVAGLRLKKSTTATNLGLKRPALGEISNRVVARSNSSVATKPLAKESVKPIGRSTSVRSVANVAGQRSEFVKPLAPKANNVASRAKRTFSNVSIASVVLPPKSADNVEKGNDKVVTDIKEIEDVDKPDLGNPLLVAEYAYEIYQYLQDLEEQYPIREGFLDGQIVTPRMRMVLVDWMVDVQLQYHLLQETLYLAIQILDRYLQSDQNVGKKYLQLVGVGAMYVACKYEEVYMPDISDFVFITDSAYTKQQLLDMEVKIVKVLDFNFSRPISLTFLRRYSKVLEANPIHHCFSKYFLELALMEYTLSSVRPSLIAAAALYLSICIYELNGKKGPEHWDAKMVHYSSYTIQEVEKTAHKLAAVVQKASSWKFEAVKKKYSNSKMMKVSMRYELEADCLKRLALGLSPFP